MKCNYYSLNLPFKHPFTISKGTKTHQPSLVVELDFNGIKGYGEAPAISYYNVTVEKMIAVLEAKKPFVEKYAFTDPERYWHYLHHLLPTNNFLVCALDIAAWDIYGKWKRQPLWRLWNLDIERIPLTDYTIGIDTPEEMIRKIGEKSWPVYKIKLGGRRIQSSLPEDAIGTSPPDDIALVKALRSCTDAPFRVDANGAWTTEQALEIIPQLADLGVELIEQPLANDNLEGMKQLYASSPLPLIADESCVIESDVEKCAGYFHGINIKLTKCSGITPARRMITKARELGLKVMLGSMNETTIGSAAIAHLSPLADYLDMDGPLLLQEDIATGISYDAGRIHVSDQPGLGVTITREII